MMKKTGIALLLLGLVAVLSLCGCTGSFDSQGNWVPGSYNGGTATLSTQKATIVLTDITGDFETSKGSGTFHFWANQADHAAIEMTGSYSITGSTITVTATPVVGTTAQKGTDAITMNLDVKSGTELGGSMSYTQDSLTFGGNINFTRYEDQ